MNNFKVFLYWQRHSDAKTFHCQRFQLSFFFHKHLFLKLTTNIYLRVVLFNALYKGSFHRLYFLVCTKLL